MMLDSGTGIVQHQCYIVRGTWKPSKPSHNVWVLSLSMIAEVTPSQVEVCDNLYQLYDCHGEQSCALLNSLELFVQDIADA
jgi:hypothetical protein